MHVHVSAIDFLVVVAYLLIAQFFLRSLAARTAHTTFGKGLGALVG